MLNSVSITKRKQMSTESIWKQIRDIVTTKRFERLWIFEEDGYIKYLRPKDYLGMQSRFDCKRYSDCFLFIINEARKNGIKARKVRLENIPEVWELIFPKRFFR